MKKAVALLAALALPVHAGVYTWTDDSGVTHFGDRAAGHSDAEQVEIRDSNPGSPVQAPAEVCEIQRRLDRAAAKESGRDVRKARQRYESARREAEESRPDYICQGAKNRLRSLEERWKGVKRQSYTIRQEQHYEQRIRDQKRHVENICR